MSLRGCCRTLSARIDCSPAMRMTRLTTIARTGRLTKRSVNFIRSVRLWPDLLLVVFGFRRRVIGWLHFVVHEHRGRVAELEHSGGHNLVACLHTRDHSYLIAAHPP